jgi:predicted RNA binding protein YcfA (HicA-like mRNA interferase family)
MPKIPGVSRRRPIRALERAGFRVVREGRKHVVMSDGNRFLTVPRTNPINAHTMGGIVTDAGLSVDAFKKLH